MGLAAVALPLPVVLPFQFRVAAAPVLAESPRMMVLLAVPRPVPFAVTVPAWIVMLPVKAVLLPVRMRAEPALFSTMPVTWFPMLALMVVSTL